MVRKVFKPYWHRCCWFVFSLFGLLVSAWATEMPSGGTVVHGDTTIANISPDHLQIQQSSQHAIIHWDSFSIHKNGWVDFQQPNANAAALNRVTGDFTSSIAGRITADGQVLLINPNGIIFTQTAQVNASGFMASTLDITDKDFLTGNFQFNAVDDKPAANVENYGNINVHDDGLVALLGANVINRGVITARYGQIALGAGKAIKLDFYGDKLLSVAVPYEQAEQLKDIYGNPLTALIDNSGTIQANGGIVHLSAKTSATAFRSAINNSGDVRAQTVSQQNGKIILGGGDTGKVIISGNLDVSGRDTNEVGGTIEITGDKIGLFDGTSIDASGTDGGGTIHIGGELQGKGETQTASVTYVDKDVNIRADAIETGDGGEVIVWADHTTRFYGELSAKGGTQTGNGGFVEVSGKQYLDFFGHVDTSATKGNIGTLLLDPDFIVIANGGADDFVTPPVNSELLFAENSGAASTLDAALINSATTNVLLQAEFDITFNEAINIVNAGTSLTAQAKRDIIVNTDITTNNADVTLTADFDSSGDGAVTMVDTATINTGNGRITITAAENITLGGLSNTNTSATAISLTSTSGEIVDGGDTNIDVISSGGLQVSAATGIGDTAGSGADNAIETTVASIDLTVTGTGDIAVNESNALIITALSTTAGNVSVNTSGNLDFAGISNIVGDLSINTANAGFIAQTGPGSLGVTGTTTLNSGAANNIFLTFATNDFGGIVTIINTNNLFLSDVNTLTLGAVTTQFNAGITTGGNIDFTGITTINGGLVLDADIHGGTNATITDSTGQLLVNGTVTLDAGATPGNIILDNTANEFLSAITISNANNLTLNDTSALTFAAVTTQGNVNINTNGSIDFTGATSIGGNLDVDTGTGGTITDTAAGQLLVTGSTTLDATTGFDIILDNATNDFDTDNNGDTLAIMNTKSVTLVDVDDITLDVINANAGGSVNVSAGDNINLNNTINSVNGDINLIADTNTSGTGAVRGNTSLLNAGIGDILIQGSGVNTFSNSLALSGNNITIGQAINLTGLGDSLTATALNDININQDISTNNGDMIFTANGTAAINGAATINSGSGNIIFNADNIALSPTSTLSGTGQLTFNPLNATASIGLGNGTTGTLNFDAGELATFQDGFSLITIGRPDSTGAVEIGNAAFTDNVLIHAGDVSLSGDISSTATGDAIIIDMTGNGRQGNFFKVGSDFITPNGRWLVYAYSPEISIEGILSSFEHEYGKSYGTSPLFSGSGFLYTLELQQTIEQASTPSFPLFGCSIFDNCINKFDEQLSNNVNNDFDTLFTDHFSKSANNNIVNKPNDVTKHVVDTNVSDNLSNKLSSDSKPDCEELGTCSKQINLQIKTQAKNKDSLIQANTTNITAKASACIPDERKGIYCNSSGNSVAAIHDQIVSSLKVIPLLANATLKHALKSVTQQMDNAAQIKNELRSILNYVLTGTTVVLSLGFVGWTYKTGALMTSLLSVMPMWSRFDPLPILNLSPEQREELLLSLEETRKEETQNYNEMANLLDKNVSTQEV